VASGWISESNSLQSVQAFTLLGPYTERIVYLRSRQVDMSKASIRPRMKRSGRGLALALFCFLFLLAARAQDPLRNVVTMGFGDVATLRKKAEGGDLEAQRSLANSLASNLRAADALLWYRKAANQGDLEAIYRIGDMLLFGAAGIPNDQRVEATPLEGIRWTFRAATNRHSNACWNMSKAFQRGIGVSTNLVEAFAWLKVSAELSTAPRVQRVHLNSMALAMDARNLQLAESLAQQFKAGHWRYPVLAAIPENDSRLKLNGISLGSKTSLCIINGKSLNEGETANVSVGRKVLTVRCLTIEKNSVRIVVEGEDVPRTLSLK